jgi:hypothetical protein
MSARVHLTTTGTTPLKKENSKPRDGSKKNVKTHEKREAKNQTSAQNVRGRTYFSVIRRRSKKATQGADLKPTPTVRHHEAPPRKTRTKPRRTAHLDFVFRGHKSEFVVLTVTHKPCGYIFKTKLVL